MECNKDEAMKAKQMAESRLQRGDFVGAVKFATKAKKLYADIENIAQILTICEVHGAAQNKLSGSHMDWYGILQTERFSDEATMKKQYKKLALLLHPDKNKFAGAEAAFKLIGEANRVLTDQAKRSLYDKKCGVSVRTVAPKTSSHHSNGNAFTAKHDGNATNYQNTTYPNPFWNAYQQARQKTFWTSCNHCKSKYQYYITFVNATLRCSQCLKSFTAHDLGSQGVPLGYTWASFNNQEEASKHGPPKPTSKGNGGKPLGGGHADKFVRSHPVSTEKCAARVGVHCKDEQIKDGYVARKGAKVYVPNPAYKAMEGDANKFVPSHPVSTEKCAARVGVHCKGEQIKDGYVARKGAKVYVPNPAYKAMDSRTSTNAGSKRVRQLAPDSRESFNTGNGDDVKDANVPENGLDPCRPRRSSRQRKHVSYAETPEDDDFESPSKKSQPNESFNTNQGEKRNEPASGGGLSNNNNPAISAAAVGDQNREVRNKGSCPPEETFLRE